MWEIWEKSGFIVRFGRKKEKQFRSKQKMSENKFSFDPQKDPEEQFTIIEKLGEGSYGSVWRAKVNSSGEEVAIKKVPVEDDLQSLMKEIVFMQNLHSPSIVQCIGSLVKGEGEEECGTNESSGELWIIMEYCGAGSVGDMMKICQKTFEEEQIAVICRHILVGLQFLHSQKMIHRDIKAGNILLDNDLNGKLADFGVSGQLTDTLAKRNTVIGTPFWMAPEVIKEVGHDYKADIWSLGITCIELAEGKPPLSDCHPMRVIFFIPSRPPPKLENPEKWSKEFNDFIALCLVKNPDERADLDVLMNHPFIVNAKTNEVLADMYSEQEKIIKEKGREIALGLNLNNDDDEEDYDPAAAYDSDAESTGSFVYNSGDSMVENDDYEEPFGTVIIGAINQNNNNNNDDDSINKDFDNVDSKNKRNSDGGDEDEDEYVPDFMQIMRQRSEAENLRQKFSSMSISELKEELTRLEEKKNAEVAAIMEDYKNKKEVINSALDLKNLDFNS